MKNEWEEELRMHNDSCVGYSVVGRAIFAPVERPNGVVHFGGWCVPDQIDQCVEWLQDMKKKFEESNK